MEHKQKAIKMIAFAVLIFSLTFISMCVQSSITKVGVHNMTVDVEIADTPQKQEKGLMGRQVLSANSGMLFVFTDEQKRSFWMKNTLLPLDIIFISSDMKIVEIKKDFAPCNNGQALLSAIQAFFCPSYTSKEIAKYVLEVNANFTDIYGISIGDSVVFS